ncbi:MAG: SCO6745 family protein [Acidimicrobiales bacterium]
MWGALEAYHALVYFAPETNDAYAAVGMKGYWMGYFASRAAPMGAVPPEVVTATFFNFHPHVRVGRAIPDAWNLAPSLDAILDARLQVADTALRRILGPDGWLDSQEITQAAELARRAVDACKPEGRALFAGHASLEWPALPHLALWHAATLLREFRGDGHVAALVAAGLDGCEALVTHAGSGAVPDEVLRSSRGWSEDEWAAAVSRLRDRGQVEGENGALSAEGRARREEVERITDEAAMAPWRALGAESCDQLFSLVAPRSRAIVEAGGVPPINPIGAPLDQ